MDMIRHFFTALAAAFGAYVAGAQPAGFVPGRLAVLRAGDGVVDLRLKQSPIFIDQFDPTRFNSSASLTVHIPTNGPDTLFFNGHAATEGNLTRSSNHKLLVFAGYGGVNLGQSNGTPSLLDIGRGFCAVDAAGTTHTTIYGSHHGEEKMNPRGAVTDGTNHFWGCGNAQGTYYYDPTGSSGPVLFDAVPNSRAMRIVQNVLYTSLNGPDGDAGDLAAGIFAFQNGDGESTPLPFSPDSKLKLVLKAEAPYIKNVGFDIKPDGSVAYMSDTVAGVQKYIRANGVWKLAYNFAIPQMIPAAENHATGCFGLVVDFAKAAPDHLCHDGRGV